jgi:uncharacterized oxidoreductase
VVTLLPQDATSLVTRLLRKSGAPAKHASVVADHLVDSSRRGVHSHGLIRVPQYIRQIRSGEIVASARPRRLAARGAAVWIDGDLGFGQVAGLYMARQAVARARRHQVGLVIAKHLGHTGRLGAYAERIAAEGCVAVIFGSGPPSTHMVAPFGGIEGRLATNPIAFAIPNGDAPVVADFASSAMPEGRVRTARNMGRRLPEGVLQDASGRATDDPAVLYEEPAGTLLPLGGPLFGHKGYAMAILVEAMATLLAGDEIDDDSRRGANLTALAIAADDGVARATARMAGYLRSARPVDPERPVLVPGDPERVKREEPSVSVDERSWHEIGTLAHELKIRMPDTI